jgi:hypothetical protein
MLGNNKSQIVGAVCDRPFLGIRLQLSRVPKNERSQTRSVPNKEIKSPETQA